MLSLLWTVIRNLIGGDISSLTFALVSNVRWYSYTSGDKAILQKCSSESLGPNFLSSVFSSLLAALDKRENTRRTFLGNESLDADRERA